MPQPMTAEQAAAVRKVLGDVEAERHRQHARFGEQAFPDGTGGAGSAPTARAVRENTDDLLARREATWRDILREELFEALAETDQARLRAELVQLAAVAVQWVEELDRRPQLCQQPGDLEGEGFVPCGRRRPCTEHEATNG